MRSFKFINKPIVIAATMVILVLPEIGIPQSKTDFDSLKIEITKLKNQISILEQKVKENELERLREKALKQAAIKEEKPIESVVFKSGQRSLQAINPEISVTGDAFFQGLLNNDYFTDENRTGIIFRVIGIHFQSNLDPFSLTKIAIEVHPEGIELGEAYVVWENFYKSLSLTAGKFRQQFGVVNRWHAHSLDQLDFPLAMTTILGEDGLNQTGFSVEWLMPKLFAHANALTIQLTNGENDHLFSGQMFSFPAILAHLKYYYDLSQNTYFELGITAMAGRNDTSGYINGNRIVENKRLTKLAGLDLTLNWEPINRAHYHSFTWRTEFYYAEKELPQNIIKALGAYSYVQYRFNERWYAGFRFDYTQPFAVNNGDKSIYQAVPYITWWQSHWVRLRLQYNFLFGNGVEQKDKVLRLQITWAAGPHKHERY